MTVARTVPFILAFFIFTNASFAQLNPLNIGVIPAGDSLIIAYDVTINTGAGSQVSNQGNISGSNFSNLVTNDPKTGAANDPTITLLNLFPLPVTLLEFRGNQRSANIELSWKASEVNVRHYEVERSNTRSAFVKIGDVQAIGNGERSYSFTDLSVIGNISYHRLKIVDVDGKISYSSILKFSKNATEREVSVYPNPVVSSQVTIRFSNFLAGQYAVAFYNSVGQQTFAKTINHIGGSVVANLNLPRSMGTGLFTVVIKGEDKQYSQKLFIER